MGRAAPPKLPSPNQNGYCHICKFCIALIPTPVSQSWAKGSKTRQRLSPTLAISYAKAARLFASKLFQPFPNLPIFEPRKNTGFSEIGVMGRTIGSEILREGEQVTCTSRSAADRLPQTLPSTIQTLTRPILPHASPIHRSLVPKSRSFQRID